jgi:hypothetical protein
VVNIAASLNTSPGWLLFGEEKREDAVYQPKAIDDDLLHYILSKSHPLFREETGGVNDFADFVLELVRDVRDIDTSTSTLEKIIDLAVRSVSSYKKKRIKKAM